MFDVFISGAYMKAARKLKTKTWIQLFYGTENIRVIQKNTLVYRPILVLIQIKQWVQPKGSFKEICPIREL